MSLPWQAMLIKDNDGDLGICFAEWIGSGLSLATVSFSQCSL
jgi:hypothetical protein